MSGQNTLINGGSTPYGLIEVVMNLSRYREFQGYIIRFDRKMLINRILSKCTVTLCLRVWLSYF